MEEKLGEYDNLLEANHNHEEKCKQLENALDEGKISHQQELEQTQEELSGTFQGYLQKIEGYEHQIESMSKMQIQLTNDMHQKQNQIDNLTQDNHNHLSKSKQLENQLKQYNHSHRQELGLKSKELIQYKQGYLETIQSLEEQIQNMNQEVMQLDNEVHEKQYQIDELVKCHQNYEEKCKQLENTLQQSKHHHNQELKKLISKQKEHNSKQHAQLENMSDLKHQIQIMNEQQSQFDNCMHEKQCLIDKLTKHNHNHESKCKELDITLQQCRHAHKQELDLKQQEVDQCKEGFLENMQSLKSLQNIHTQMLKGMQSKQCQIDQLTENNHKHTEKCQKLEKTLQKQKDEHKYQLEQKHQVFVQSTQKCNEYVDTLQCHKNEIECTNNKYQQLQHEMQEKQCELDELLEAYHNHEQKCKQLENTLQQYEHSNKQKFHSKDQKLKQKYKETMQNHTHKIESMNRKHTKLLKCMQLKQCEIDKLIDNNLMHTKNYQELENTLRQQKHQHQQEMNQKCREIHEHYEQELSHLTQRQGNSQMHKHDVESRVNQCVQMEMELQEKECEIQKVNIECCNYEEENAKLKQEVIQLQTFIKQQKTKYLLQLAQNCQKMVSNIESPNKPGTLCDTHQLGNVDLQKKCEYFKKNNQQFSKKVQTLELKISKQNMYIEKLEEKECFNNDLITENEKLKQINSKLHQDYQEFRKNAHKQLQIKAYEKKEGLNEKLIEVNEQLKANCAKHQQKKKLYEKKFHQLKQNTSQLRKNVKTNYKKKGEHKQIVNDTLERDSSNRKRGSIQIVSPQNQLSLSQIINRNKKYRYQKKAILSPQRASPVNLFASTYYLKNQMQPNVAKVNLLSHTNRIPITQSQQSLISNQTVQPRSSSIDVVPKESQLIKSVVLHNYVPLTPSTNMSKYFGPGRNRSLAQTSKKIIPTMNLFNDFRRNLSQKKVASTLNKKYVINSPFLQNTLKVFPNKPGKVKSYMQPPFKFGKN